MIHPINEHLVPKLCLADYPDRRGAPGAEAIVSQAVLRVLNGASISVERQNLFSYLGEPALAAFDRWLIDHLNNCDVRPSPLVI